MKNLKSKLIILSLIILGFTFFTMCTKDSENNEKQDIIKGLTYYEESSTDLASLHNSVVADLYYSLNFSDSAEAMEQIWYNFTNNVSVESSILEELQMSRDSFNNLAIFIWNEVKDCQFDVRNSDNYSMYGAEVNTYINQLFSIVEDFDENSTASNMLSQIYIIKGDAASNLTGAYLDYVNSVADVLSGSIQLWLPSYMGGDGYMDLLGSKKGNTSKVKLSEQQKAAIKGALLADASSMAIGLQVTAWSALLTGGTMAPATLVSACIKAALSSAFAGFVGYFSS
jgi:hypothetical protein